MATFRIEGGHPLSGTVRASGNKNAALPILAASLLADQAVWVRNLPRIGDVDTLLDLLKSMGVKLAWQGRYDVRIAADRLERTPPDPELCRRVRGSVLFAAPLLARFGEAEIPFPGGDKIGRRRIDTHLLALEEMGVRVSVGAASVRLSAPRGLAGADILLDEASVTATENAVMVAAVARGDTVIRNAACEPHVQELCRFLRTLGADIEGIGTNELRVRGVEHLGGGEATLGADYLEVASFVALAAVTGGEMTVEGVTPADLRMILWQFQRLGIEVRVSGNSLFVPRGQALAIRPDCRGAVPTIASSPWPAFPADLTSVALVAATQCKGSVMIHEKMFESRLFFVDQLLDMGAQIVLCDPHRAVVVGPSRLHGSRMTSPDIRAGMALLMAALAAEGVSEIGNIGQIDRGYEKIDERLRALGARIERSE